MTWADKLAKAWQNRNQIAEGFYNLYISHRESIKEEAARRLSICESNQCGYWDATGTHENLFVKGEPGCTGCGCNGKLKTACMSCHCYLRDIGKMPLWDAVMTPEQERDIDTIEEVLQKHENGNV
jgi:hypothetical protein